MVYQEIKSLRKFTPEKTMMLMTHLTILETFDFLLEVKENLTQNCFFFS